MKKLLFATASMLLLCGCAAEYPNSTHRNYADDSDHSYQGHDGYYDDNGFTMTAMSILVTANITPPAWAGTPTTMISAIRTNTANSGRMI